MKISNITFASDCTMFRPVRKKFEGVHTLMEAIDEQH